MGKIFSRIAICVIWAVMIFSGLRISTNSSLFNVDKNTLHLFTWPEQFQYDAIYEFEELTGIKVVVHSYETNEELIAKMNKTKGKGYDIIAPSDYAVKILAKNDLLKKIDKSKIDFFNELDPFLLNRNFDPDNEYSLPFDWEVFGFGINRQFNDIPQDQVSWDLIFNKDLVDYKIAMSNDPIEAISFASFYLYGKKESLSPQEYTELSSLLVDQKNWVEAYAAIRGDYLLVTKNCQVALSPSAFILKAMKDHPDIDFVLPNEGTFLTIENVSIPKASDKDELIYTFLNFIYQKEKFIENTDYFLTFPARLDVLEDTEVTDAYKRILAETRKDRSKVHNVDFIMPEASARQLWVKVKSS